MNTATKRRNTSNTSSNSNNTASSQMAVSNNTVSVPVSTDLASLFECPVCFDYVLPPILQCQSGHLVCSSCRPKLTCCPTCRGPLGKFHISFVNFSFVQNKLHGTVKSCCLLSYYLLVFSCLFISLIKVSECLVKGCCQFFHSNFQLP